MRKVECALSKKNRMLKERERERRRETDRQTNRERERVIFKMQKNQIMINNLNLLFQVIYI